jgi:hypothetical protein
MGALADAPLAVEQANFRALDSRMWSSLNAPTAPAAWVGRPTITATRTFRLGPTNGSGHMNTVAVGLDMKVSDPGPRGAMFGYTDTKGDFGGPGGGYTLKQPVAPSTRYGNARGTGGRSAQADPRLLDIPRHPARRGGSHRERRGPQLQSFTGRLLGGYWFTMKDLIHGPYARLADEGRRQAVSEEARTAPR